MPRQGYAPTPHSYVPNTAMSATISLDDEVRLADTRAERDLQDSLAEIFSIIVTIDELEKAFLKDAIPESDYTDICERSLKQYRSILADETVATAFGDLEEFKAEWDVCVVFPAFHGVSSGDIIWLPTYRKTHPPTLLVADTPLYLALASSSRSPAPQSASGSACPRRRCRPRRAGAGAGAASAASTARAAPETWEAPAAAAGPGARPAER